MSEFEIFSKVNPSPELEMANVVISYPTKNGNGAFTLSIDNLQIKPGIIHCLYGTNGSGKTTLMRFLSGIVMSRKGQVAWKNVSVPLIPGRDFVFVTQAGPWPHWSVWRNIYEPQLEAGATIQEGEKKTAHLVALLGLKGLEDRMSHELSSGQQQRTVLARALALSPKILFLDEIMSGQSEFWSGHIAQILKSFTNAGGMALVVSHDPEWVMANAERVTHVVSKHDDAVSSVDFFCGYDGDIDGWVKFRDTRLRAK